ncbi:SirB2 family protein [Cellvibrio sp. NN19]|uniref:SirB2 family protein n=1 Tax=Cellvibrio chitinivorans TaxID=3102792 RepID=UPI002B40AB9A|nr:SirB2 family protein [Cellvibrio sp. NN19]
MYLALKHLHLTFVALSLLAFVIRGIWLFMGSSMLTKKWVKILPHIISTILLVSGIAVAVHLGMSPGSQPWLMAKIIGLIVYIGLGVAAFKAANPTTRKLCWVIALVVFAYIVSVAVTKSPAGFFG